MSEIEKTYENAGVKPTKNWQSCLNCKLKTEKFCDEWGEEYFTCINFETPEKCSNAKEYYPLFTAEKQIEIVKFLLKKAVYYDVKDDKYWFYYEECESAGYKPFDEAIAHFINKLWQSLTEEEKQQVKGILE